MVLYLFDAERPQPLDRETVDLLRKSQKPLFAVNKLDSRRRQDNLYEFYALGLAPLYAISAEHGLGIPDLFDDIVENFPDAGARRRARRSSGGALRIAVVSRPNVASRRWSIVY